MFCVVCIISRGATVHFSVQQLMTYLLFRPSLFIRSFNEDHVCSLVLDWLKKHIEGNHDRLEEAMENDVNLLYLHSDNTLHDCIECNDDDDSAALNNSEIIQVTMWACVSEMG